MTNPKITIGLPVYNGENFLEEQLESLLDQTYRDFELIISDNGSTDSTPDICKKYADMDDRIRYIRHDQNQGASWNFNYVVEEARGYYFKWAAHDDVHLPTYLEKCLEIMETRPGVILCHTLGNDILSNGEVYKPSRAAIPPNKTPKVQRFRLLTRGKHNCVAVFGLMRLHELKKTHLIAPYVGADKNLLSHLSLLGDFYFLDEPLFLNRHHPDRSVQHHGKGTLPYLRWFAPEKARRTHFGYFEFYKNLFNIVKISPLTPKERFICRLIAFQTALTRRKRLLMKDLVDYFKKKVS